MVEILCSKSDEFVYNKDGFYYIGANDVLLHKLDEILHIELPFVGEVYAKGEIFGYIEAKSIATELYMPVTGKIQEVNSKLNEKPNELKNLPIEDLWLIKISSEFFEEDKKDLIEYNKFKG